MAAGGGAKVQSVQHALDVLEQVAFANEELGVTQIAERLALTKGSVHRHLTTLVERGYLAQNPATARYGLGPKCRLLTRTASFADPVRAAEEAMRELRDEAGHTVVLSVLAPRGALVMATTASASAIEIGVRPGSELSFHASAQGRVLVAFGSPSLRRRVLAGPLQPFTGKTVVDRKEVERILDDIVARGFGTAPEQVLLGINAVAAPVFDAQGACVAAVALVGSIQFLPPEPARPAVAALLRAARRVSQRLGHPPAPDAPARRNGGGSPGRLRRTA